MIKLLYNYKEIIQGEKILVVTYSSVKDGKEQNKIMAEKYNTVF